MSPDFLLVDEALVGFLVHPADVVEGLEGVERSGIVVQDVAQERGARSPARQDQDVLGSVRRHRVAQEASGHTGQR